MNKIDPDEVLTAILRYLGSEDGELTPALEKQVRFMSVYEGMDSFLRWHGMIGYTSMIIKALDGLRASTNKGVL